MRWKKRNLRRVSAIQNYTDDNVTLKGCTDDKSIFGFMIIYWIDIIIY